MSPILNPTSDESTTEDEDGSEQIAQLTAQRQELERQLDLKKANETALAGFSSGDRLMILGAGVDPEDIIWRVKAGCLVHQAILVSLAQPAEDQRVAASVAKR